MKSHTILQVLLKWVVGMMFVINTCKPEEESSLTVDVLCKNIICEEYILTEGCPELSKECNSSGIILPDVTTCNCCPTCFLFLKEDDECTVGSPGQIMPTSICGPALACKDENGKASCKPMNTACVNLQQEFKYNVSLGNQMLTAMPPDCDIRGDFSPVQCIPNSICFCVSPKTGERIFGELPYSVKNYQSMSCGCSVISWEAKNMLGGVSSVTRCLPDGSYDPLQCVDARCTCVDTVSGKKDANSDIVHLVDVNENSLHCFNSQNHYMAQWLKPCEIEIEMIHLDILQAEESNFTVVHPYLPNCAPDGSYSRLQRRQNMLMCVDPEGVVIEDYFVFLNDSLARCMDCNCARTKWVLEKAGVVELPVCTHLTGNFRPWQCWRGYCYCVNRNGVQITMEVKEDNFDEKQCPEDCVENNGKGSLF